MPDHPITVPAQLGPVLRGLRRHRRLSQAALGERLGITKQAVSQLERAPHRAAFERVHRACAVLGVDIILRPRTPSTLAW